MSQPIPDIEQFVWESVLYSIYHINGTVVEVLAHYGNCCARPEPLDLDDLPKELRQKIDDHVNFNS